MKKQKHNYWKTMYEWAKEWKPIDRKKIKGFNKRQVVIEEVARIALEDRQYRQHLKHELGVTHKEMNDALRHLCSLLKSK